MYGLLASRLFVLVLAGVCMPVEGDRSDYVDSMNWLANTGWYKYNVSSQVISML